MARDLIIDANSLIVRHIMATALADLSSSGKLTGGIFGTLRALRLLVSTPEWQVGRIYAFFDHSVPPSRRALLPEYKADRAEKTSSMFESEEQKVAAFAQIQEVWKILPLLGIKVMCHKNREADDGCAAAVRILRPEGRLLDDPSRPIVVSSDKDLYQTVNLGADVWDLSKKVLVDSQAVQEIVGVMPSSMCMYRALTGDSSDNIAGIKGYGPKRAAALLERLYDEWPDMPADMRDTPLKELSSFLSWLSNRPDRSKQEDLILEQQEYLGRVVRAIDLSDSWGSLSGLEEEMADVPKVQQLPFLRAAKGLGMASILGDAKGFLRPFLEAEKRASK